MEPFAVIKEKNMSTGPAEIDRIVREHGNDPTDLVDILLDIEQASDRCYINEAAAAYVARVLQIKITQVYDAITFYNALHDTPRAKYPIGVCSSAACRVNDSETLVDALKEILGIAEGEVTYDGRFMIETVPCFGACDVSPAVRVNGVVYGNLTSREKILDMLKQLD